MTVLCDWFMGFPIILLASAGFVLVFLARPGWARDDAKNRELYG